MDEGVAAARLQFPARVEAIDELAARDNVFCEICRDFAEAREELASWEASSDPNRDERCAEYRELVAGLGKEIEDALDNATVLPFPQPATKHPP
jgi:hypothetical protein